MLDIEPCHQPILSCLGLNSFDAITARFRPAGPSAAAGVRVEPKTLEAPGYPALAVFYKQYDYHPGSWRFFGRRSKARCEHENYRVFRELDIPCAEPVACGEQRDRLGRLERAFILTVAIPDALNLVEFVTRHCPQRNDETARQLRHEICQQLAAMTRRIHAAGFFHHDLVWRNVLVTWKPPARPKVWWIDCPRGQFDRVSPWRRGRVLKDLASLDKSAVKYCSRGERVTFLRAYLGEKRLSAQGKHLLRDVLKYRKHRWPEDWEGR
jgi:hypothetical protein